jgi:hypothetical protein
MQKKFYYGEGRFTGSFWDIEKLIPITDQY